MDTDSSACTESLNAPLPDVAVSLLPARLIELCDLVECDWSSVRLPAPVSAGSWQASLAALNLHRLADLRAVAPLAVLALANELTPGVSRLERVWADALATVSSMISPLLVTAMIQPLTEALVAPNVAAAGFVKQATGASDVSLLAPCSALVFDPVTVVGAIKNDWEGARTFALWLPSGESQIAGATYQPAQAPLLSAAVCSALFDAGYNLNASITTLTWPSARTLNACLKAGYPTLADLVSQTPQRLLERRNIGPQAYLDIVATLREHLASWLKGMPFQLLLGDDSVTPSSAAQPLVAAESADALNAATTATDAPPAKTEKAPDPFDALRASDLLVVLDLYHAAWRDLPVSALTPQTTGDAVVRAMGSSRMPAGSAAPEGIAAFTASSLDSANRLLAELAPLLATAPFDLALADLTVGELLAPAPSASPLYGRPMYRARAVLNELTDNLITLLLQQVVRPEEPHNAARGVALATLAGVTIADLLRAFFATPGALGKQLQPQMVEILVARNGLRDGQPQTLEAVARPLGITRERVRQIESRAYKHLNNAHCLSLSRALGALVRRIVQAQGGVATLTDATACFGAVIPFGDVDPAAATSFIAALAGDVRYLSNGRVLVAPPYTEMLVRRTQQALREVAQARGALAPDDLIAEASIVGGAAVLAAGAAFVAATLATMGDIVERDGRYQPTGSGSLRSRIIQAMASIGHPAHFSEIAAQYRRLFPEDAERSDNAVHAFFSRFEDDFVLVGSGIFALADWGYDPRLKNIPALVEHILAGSVTPLHDDEVVARAMRRYHWKAQSIRAQLNTNPRIQPFGNRMFGLRGRSYENSALGALPPEQGEATQRERLVVGVFTNTLGRLVVQMRLSPRILTTGDLPLSSRPLRDLFAAPGDFHAVALAPNVAETPLTLRCARHTVSGLRSMLLAAHVSAGDDLFIERLDAPAGAGAAFSAPVYRLALGPTDHRAEIMSAVGLNAPGERAGNTGTDTLYYARKPQRIARLVVAALEHSWVATRTVNDAINCAPTNPAGREYLHLAQALGVVAVDRLANEEVLRPTAAGRAWACASDLADVQGRQLALAYPPYRAHLRALGVAPAPGAAALGLSQQIRDAWDALCGFTSDHATAEALEQTAALLSVETLTGSALPLLLLLLAAQSQGQGLERSPLAAILASETQERQTVDTALCRLRTLGLALCENDTGRIALAEGVNLTVASPFAVEQALAAAGSVAGDALAQAWRNALAAAPAGALPHASALYSGLQVGALPMLYAALATPPTATPEAARYVDAELRLCAFPSLVADWAAQEASVRETVLSWSLRSERRPGQPLLGVALCDELLTQPWDAAQHLAGNAHLALLTIIATDEGALAELLGRGDNADWRLAGVPLVSALDALLRALGYDPWNELYRAELGRQAQLGRELVALAERLVLLTVEGARLEAVNGLATRVYYEACAQGFTERLADALRASPAPV